MTGFGDYFTISLFVGPEQKVWEKARLEASQTSCNEEVFLKKGLEDNCRAKALEKSRLESHGTDLPGQSGALLFVHPAKSPSSELIKRSTSDQLGESVPYSSGRNNKV